MIDRLAEIETITLEANEEIENLANKYIIEGIIPSKYQEDAMHIAIATYHNCDFLVSWNFKHIVRDKTIIEANGVNTLMGYKEIGLITPESIIGGDET